MNKIVKQIDRVGHFVTPKELRRYYGILPDDNLELIPTSKGILVRRYKEDREEFKDENGKKRE